MFVDKETYYSMPLTRWFDKSGKTIKDDYPELFAENQKTKMLGRQSGMPVQLLLMSKLVRETLKAKGYDREEGVRGRAIV